MASRGYTPPAHTGLNALADEKGIETWRAGGLHPRLTLRPTPWPMRRPLKLGEPGVYTPGSRISGRADRRGLTPARGTQPGVYTPGSPRPARPDRLAQTGSPRPARPADSTRTRPGGALKLLPILSKMERPPGVYTPGSPQTGSPYTAVHRYILAGRIVSSDGRGMPTHESGVERWRRIRF